MPTGYTAGVINGQITDFTEYALMCESKVGYDNEEQAFQKNQKSYRCPYCGKWHRSGAFTKLVRQIEKEQDNHAA